MNFLVIGYQRDGQICALTPLLSQSEAETRATVFRAQLEGYDRIEVEQLKDGDARAQDAREAQGPLYRLTLRALVTKLRGGEDRAPIANRLRFLLKTLLRQQGFRCVRFEELPPENH